jgi:hypothetical protein
MTTDRPYAHALSLSEAMASIRGGSGGQHLCPIASKRDFLNRGNGRELRFTDGEEGLEFLRALSYVDIPWLKVGTEGGKRDRWRPSITQHARSLCRAALLRQGHRVGDMLAGDVASTRETRGPTGYAGIPCFRSSTLAESGAKSRATAAVRECTPSVS